ncbi:MAG: acetate kinase [delta proteobacterium ML8_F1]|nr:MAG: acetate kinase [delta proteobacterium ML8_F1]
MKVIVINCGSSSLKYQLLNMEDESLMAIGLVERIGLDGAQLKHETVGKDKQVIVTPMKNHKDALKVVLDALVDPGHGVIKSLNEIDAAGHRVVHAGEKFSGSVKITDAVMDALEECIELAPLHNPPNIMGIKAIQELLPSIVNVGVFDTAFHQTMPASSYIYPLPYEYYEKYGLRRYGFHGTSHRYVSERAASILGMDYHNMKIVTCHLGNGASATAVLNGKSVATSMGFTPLEGLAMGTRTGDLDPAIVTYLMSKENLSIQEMDNILNKKSGVLGISGISSDFRDIEEAADAGNQRAKLAVDVFRLRVKKYIAAYAAVMGGVDAVVFTAGLGENSPVDRKAICEGLEFMGLSIDDEKNNVRGKETVISTDDSKVKVLLIPTNEELTIARDTIEILGTL